MGNHGNVKNIYWGGGGNVVYIWFESWTAAFADTFEPDWPLPRYDIHGTFLAKV